MPQYYDDQNDKQYANKLMPEPIKMFIIDFDKAIANNNIGEIENCYEIGLVLIILIISHSLFTNLLYLYICEYIKIWIIVTKYLSRCIIIGLLFQHFYALILI